MILLAYILFFAVYLLVSIGLVILAVKFSRKRGYKGWIVGSSVAVFMWLLIFWDWIPVLIEHKHLCETQAGFWEYKTPEEWIKENPETVGEDWGSAEWDKLHKDEKLPEGVQRYWASSRIYLDVLQNPDFAHAIGRREQRLIDSKTNQILAKSIEFYRGSTNFDSYKIWLAVGHRMCGSDSIGGNSHIFMNNAEKLIELGKGEK